MLDELSLRCIAGHGGNGAVSFRREKYVPRGGPDGGDGGDGGDVVLVGDPGMLVLDELRGKKITRAADGGAGRSNKAHGRNGEDVIVKVPVGTAIYCGDAQLADLIRPGMRAIVAKGGQGGRGNSRFATSVRRAPRIAERGLPGEDVSLRLELRLLAEAGLVGLPNAGKSSLLRAMSEARPKVGAYPFTTLEPNLGVVTTGYESVVVADIPGLIEGAHEGAGLGIAFLRHIERTVLLVHVVDVSAEDPKRDIRIIREEMEAFGHGLVDKPWLLALNKIDLPGAEERAIELGRDFKREGIEAFALSALNGEGTGALVDGILEQVLKIRKEQPAAEAVVLRPRPIEALDVRKRGDGVFMVGGQRAAQVIQKLGLDSDEARLEVDRRLRRMGVAKALERAGARPGDRVRIGDVEVEWPL
jgi:GTP-binding protein